MPVPPAASTSSAVSSIVSGRSYSERRSRVLRPRAVDGRAGLAERDRDAAAGPARGARDERDLALERRAHAVTSSGPAGGSSDRDHRQQDERAAGELRRAERLAEDRERERDGHHRLERRQDRGGRGPDAPQAGEEERDRADRRDEREAREPDEAGRAHAARVEVAAGEAGEREGGGGAGADERAERERAHALGDALRDEDVAACRRRPRRARARCRQASSAPRPRPRGRGRGRRRRARARPRCGGWPALARARWR